MLARWPVEALHGGLRPGLPVPESGLRAHQELQTRGREALSAEEEAGILAALWGAFL